MNRVPATARTALWKGLVDVTDGTLSCLLVADTYTYSSADEFLDDLSGGEQVASALVASVSVVDGEVFGDVDDFAAVPAGPDVTSVWFFLDTGTPATSRLLAWADRYGDGRAVLIETNGGNVTLNWPSDRLFAIGSPIS